MLDTTNYKTWRWWSVALRGVAAIVFGVLALTSPGAAFASLMILFGIYAIADGILAFALGPTPFISRGLVYARALVSIVAGIIALSMPVSAGLALVVVIGCWAIAAGSFEIVTAVRLRQKIEHEWLLGIEGAISVALGMVLLFSPLAGAIVLSIWIGMYALVVGGMTLADGLRLRRVQMLMPAAA